jgi:Short-chain dehydrogenases of various substrate specificities
MNLDINGKNALIAGSTQGIGLAIAKELALLGANCTLIARNEASLKQAVSTLDTTKGQVHEYLVADYSDYKQVAQTVQDYVANKTMHILINNSGGPAAGPIVDATPEAFLNTFQQHLICNQLVTQALIPRYESGGLWPHHQCDLHFSENTAEKPWCFQHRKRSCSLLGKNHEQ